MLGRDRVGRGGAELLVAAAVFAASELLARALGVRFAHETLGTLYQYLDPAILREDLLRGLYYLHAQPPLFNLFLGAVLKAFPGAYPAAFSAAFGAIGLGLLFALLRLLRRFDVPPILSVALLAAFALGPSFPVYRHWLFYTLPVAALLAAAALALARYVEAGRRRDAGAFAALAATVMLTRALFHPLWLAAVLGAVLPLLDAPRRRRLVAAALVPFALTGLLFAKNERLVGTFAGSSWLGLSLTKRWPLSQREMRALRAEGVLPPVWHRRPFREPAALRPFGYFADDGPFVHPALDAPYKSNGEPNFNHRDYARISRELTRVDLELVRRFPDRYAQRVATAFLLFVQPGPNSVHFLVDYDFGRVAAYRDGLTRTVYRGGAVERPIRMLAPPPNVWLVGLPALLVFGLVASVRRENDAPLDGRPVVAFAVVTALWVCLVANLVEIGENDRMRWEVEPLLTLLLGIALARAGRWLAGRRRGGAGAS